MAGGHGWDQEYQAEAVGLSCPMSHIGMSSYGWETQTRPTHQGALGFLYKGYVVTVPWGPAR